MKKLFLCFMVSLLLFPLASYAQDSEPLSPRKKSDPTTYREQRIYVPYEHLKEVLQKKEKGVYIPYSDFIKLWEEWTRKPPDKPLPLPPIDGAIINAEYRGRVYEDIAQFHGELKISALKEKWGEILLQFQDTVSLGRLFDTFGVILGYVSPEFVDQLHLCPGIFYFGAVKMLK